MADNTLNLNLYKKDPVVDGNDTFNIKTMLNDNWDKIDADAKAKGDAIFSLSQSLATANTNITNLGNSLNTTNQNVTNLDNTVNSHLAESMPHKFIGSDGKTYRWGLSVVNGIPTMNYEEVI